MKHLFFIWIPGFDVDYLATPQPLRCCVLLNTELVRYFLSSIAATYNERFIAAVKGISRSINQRKTDRIGFCTQTRTKSVHYRSRLEKKQNLWKKSRMISPASSNAYSDRRSTFSNALTKRVCVSLFNKSGRAVLMDNIFKAYCL